MDVLEIRSRLADSALVRDVDVVPRGHVRLETSFIFPEGSSLDLYVVAPTEGAESGCLSDLGETLDWLLDVEVNPQESPRQKKLLEMSSDRPGSRCTGGLWNCRFRRSANSRIASSASGRPVCGWPT